MDTPTSTPSPPRRRRRRLLLFLVLLPIAAYGSGIPQKILIERIGGRALGATLRVDGDIQLIRGVISGIRIHDRNADASKDRPAIAIGDIEFGYSLSRSQGSYVPHAKVSHVRINADYTDPDHPNLVFVEALLAAPAAGPSPFLPRTIEIHDLVIQYRDQRQDARMASLKGEIALDTEGKLTRASAGGEGNAIGVSWKGEDEASRLEVADGSLDLTLAMHDGQISGRFALRLPDIVDADVEFSPDADGGSVNALAKTLDIRGGPIAALLATAFPVPVKFDRIEASGSRIEAPLGADAVAWPGGEIVLSATGLVIGEPEHALYEGNLAVSGAMTGGESASGTGKVLLAEGLALDLTMSGDPESSSLAISFADWPKDAVTKVAPKDLRERLGALNYASLGGEATAEWKGQAYEIVAEFESTGAATKADAIQLTVNANGLRETGPLLEGSFESRIGEGTVTGSARVESENEYSVDAEFDAVPIAPWARLFLGDAVKEPLEGTLKGTAAIALATESDFVDITSEFAVAAPVYGELSFEQLEMTVSLRMTPAFDRIEEGTLEVSAGEFQKLSLAGTMDLGEPMSGQATLEGTIDLTSYATVLGLKDLWGETQFAVRATIAEGVLAAPITLTAPTLGHGDYSIPYGTPLVAKGDLHLDLDDYTGGITALSVVLGEATRLDAAELTLALDPMAVSAPFTLTTDMVPLAGMGYVDEIRGLLNASGTFALVGEHVTAAAKFEGKAETLTLKDKLAVLQDVTVSGDASMGEQTTGSLDLTAGLFTAAGAIVHDAAGHGEIDDEGIVLPDLRATIFEGSVVARVDFRFPKEEAPWNVVLTPDFTAIDLARLTEEIQPPKVKLTGIADGSAMVAYTPEGLRDFRIDAYSATGFSMNRDAVSEALQSPQFQSALGSKQIAKAMDKFLGKAEMRPFDTAGLRLRLLDGRIVGNTVMKSEKTRDYNGLNMTIGVTMDPSALAEGLKLVQENAIENVELGGK